MADSKTSQLPYIAPEDVVATDRIVVLDKSATSGPGSGPGGTLKQTEASAVGLFGSVPGILYNLSLSGINPNQSIFGIVKDAINTFGPFEVPRGYNFIFRITQHSGAPGNLTVTRTNFKLLSGALIAGGAGNEVTASQLAIDGGPYITNPEINQDLFLEIGNTGALPVHTYFNLGAEHIADGDPWVIAGQQFLTGQLDGVPTIWQFLAGDGDWGGDSGNFTTAADFLNLSLQPPAVGFAQTKVHALSLTGIDTNQPELNYIATAVATYGPFTCLPGQQMVLKTTTLSGGTTGGGGIPTFDVVTRYYRVIPNVQTIGGPLGAIVYPSYFMPDGQGLVRLDEEDDALVAELGNIGAGPVEDAFNLGDPNSDPVNEPWDMAVKRFVRATLDGEITLWAFVGDEGLYGPGELTAVAEDFENITEQPILLSLEENIVTLKTVLDTDLATVDEAGLATYYNALDPGVLKQGYESWRIVVVDDEDAIVKTFDLVNRGKGPVGAEAVAANVANTLTADMFFEINIGGGDGIAFTTDESLYLDPSTLELRANVSDFSEKYTYTSGDQEFVLTSTPTKIIFISVNGQLLEDPLTQWEIDVPTKTITILDEMDVGDRVTVHYQYFIEV